ncbi:hypothetical protein EJB05_07510 [Eragrostis curvula]|uniref:Uncharacterized protein n=1 Tax=Eragrostis curvula TaxID=38414 RepID=A0A5J9WKV6_9POAL|nr:hypothetical protein EJB05_07510 [Eragrostis curvula]
MSPRLPLRPTHRSPRRSSAACYLLVLTLAAFLASAAAKSSRRPITDIEIRQKKDACYTDVEKYVLGCCAVLWCCYSVQSNASDGYLSAALQRAVGMDVQVVADGEGELRAALPLAGVLQPHIRRRPVVQLEEGELDYVRGQEYKYCMHNVDDGKESVIRCIDYLSSVIPWRKLGWREGILHLLIQGSKTKGFCESDVKLFPSLHMSVSLLLDLHVLPAEFDSLRRIRLGCGAGTLTSGRENWDTARGAQPCHKVPYHCPTLWQLARPNLL